ncbi:MAG: hypothetical protein NTU44_05330 [Bacteroidetes bacterium]|nr:hypothetical protein [Bacteroidota bacterium]
MKISSFNLNPLRITLLSGVLFIVCALWVSYSIKHDFVRMIWADGEGYYQYLTAFFLHHDLKAQPYAYFLPDGTAFNKYNYGVALLQTPFFLSGLLFSKLMGIPLTGHTSVNGFFIVLSTITYAFLGMYLVFRFLRRMFSLSSIFVTLALIFLGSNLFFYTLVESGLSHTYSFFLISWLIFQTPRFLDKPDWKNTILCAFPVALATLVRPTNVVSVFFIFLYDVNSIKDLLNRIRFFFLNTRILLIFLGISLVVFLPQMYYWHLTTGKWLVYSYHYSYTDNEDFRYWSNPKIIQILLGVRSGWLVYSPLMALSLAGIVFAFIQKTAYRWAVLVVLVITVYINASWWYYTFACGFGYRSLVDYYGLLSIPFALSIQQLGRIRSWWIKGLLSGISILLIFINIRMSVFYDASPCWDGPNWEWRDYLMILRMVLNI